VLQLLPQFSLQLNLQAPLQLSLAVADNNPLLKEDVFNKLFVEEA